MNKFLFVIFATVLLIFNVSGTQAATTALFDWGFNIDGTTYCLLGPCDFDVDRAANITGPEDLPSFIDISDFDFTAGLGSISITLSDMGSHSLVMFVDHDIDEVLNGFINETGIANGSPEMGQTWELDEPGGNYSEQNGSEGFPYYGDIFFDNFLDGIPDNQAFYDAIDDQTLTPPDDVAMQMGWDFELVEGQTATTVFLLSDTSIPQGFHLVHRDPDSDVNVFFSSSLDTGQVSGPEVEIPSGIPAMPGETVTVPVNYIANGNGISTAIFSVDFDENNLSFDPSDNNFDTIPDSITFNVSPFVYAVGVSYDPTDSDGELDFNIADVGPPLTPLPDVAAPGFTLLTITFGVGDPAVTTAAPVNFSQDPPVSFGNTDGASVPGITIDGSVLITVQCNPTGTSETICNGVDDDCDGSIDEDFAPVTTTCGLGECAATGQTSCSDGVEGDTCTPNTPTAEICDNLDNDCDGAIDDNLSRATTCGAGECGATGAETCSAGAWGNDTCTPGTPSAEVCDNLDNDCDGSTDENLTRPTTCGVGECGATGDETCSAGAWGNDTCTPGTPSAEVCDNLDNDCDGSTDENLTRPTTCGAGECAGNTGEESCSAGTWGGDTCDPLAGAMPEGSTGNMTCTDGIDNDCDGLVDTDDTACEKAGADVFLTKLKAPHSVKVKKGKTKTKKIKVFGLTDAIAQRATVNLMVNRIDAVTVNIHPGSRTRTVNPGDNPKKFKFKADISCNKTGEWKLQWVATIDAPQNADTSNDTMRASTIVTCKKNLSGWHAQVMWWKIRTYLEDAGLSSGIIKWDSIKHFFTD